MWMYFLVSLWLSADFIVLGITLPKIRNAIQEPKLEFEGTDVLFTCIVQDLANYTVTWRKENLEKGAKILTAAENRVTSDSRFSVIHDNTRDTDQVPKIKSGGDVWVLQIRNVQKSDAGFYVCEINTNPVTQSFHVLSVYSGELQPPDIDGDSEFAGLKTKFSRMHNFEKCCRDQKVADSCLPFCNIAKIIEGNVSRHYDYKQCVTYTPIIVQCMADGRNHVPCCIKEHVPDLCLETCRGEETMLTDNIKSHFSCSNYMEEIIGCISEGVEILPKYPENVQVEPLTERSIRISWSRPKSNGDTVTEYAINITSLRFFGDDLEDSDSDSGAGEVAVQSPKKIHSVQLKVPGNTNFTIVNSLVPYTIYQIQITSLNIHGSSLPSYAVRTLTLSSNRMIPFNMSQTPKLPDIKQCCIDQGISQTKCLDKLCDPVNAENIEVVDLMMCAPWSSKVFKCLANDFDHTPCCRSRGLPEHCQHLCSGNVTSINYSYFKCLKYMPEYSNCLLQGYGVLPSSPTGFYIMHIDVDFAILSWSSPKTLGDTVLHYNVHYRVNSADDDTDYDNEDNLYNEIFNVQSPYILANIRSNTTYEVFVTAVNVHGIGEPSTRILFTTDHKIVINEINKVSSYNITECCVKSNLSQECLPLCSYDASVNDIDLLANTCSGEFSKLLRCGAGGRDHTNCCDRRGVVSECSSLCSGVADRSVLSIAAYCTSFIGNIVLCFEEGTGLLPGPVEELHAINVDNNSVALRWKAPSDNSNVTYYLIFYQQIENQSKINDLTHFRNKMKVNSTSYLLSDLQHGKNYQIYVVAVNVHGSSLPSSIIEVDISEDSGKKTLGMLSAPHSLAVINPSATYFTITWQPPQISYPSEQVSYRLFYKKYGESKFRSISTTVTSVLISNLKPNLQYIIYVKAVSDRGESSASETLIAWTNPALPASVEIPTVHPSSMIVEGSMITILCIALGSPTPTISLYISGRLVHRDASRYMITIIPNVSREMNQISCYADNGYGSPTQASRYIDISYEPTITLTSGKIMAKRNSSVTVICTVDAFPEPKMVFLRNAANREPVVAGGKYSIDVSPIRDENSKFLMQLTIENITDEEAGDYFCRAENVLGSDLKQIKVQIRNYSVEMNVAQCCGRENVSDVCMSVCTFNLDVDSILSTAFECLPDFNKFLKCASDQSDHRSCCLRSGVPKNCLDWCRGQAIDEDNDYCLLSHTKQIFSCFFEGESKLPGPPHHIQLQRDPNNSIRISWQPPSKNPHTVEMYRVFWREMGSKVQFKNETSNHFLVVDDLNRGSTYEFIVKAANRIGMSISSEPVVMEISDNEDHSYFLSFGLVMSVIFSLFVIVIIVVGAAWLFGYRRTFAVKSYRGNSIENPNYLRDDMDNVLSPTSLNDPNLASNLNMSAFSNQRELRPEILHVPTENEISPSLYEELRLGQNGVGFKRLKD